MKRSAPIRRKNPLKPSAKRLRSRRRRNPAGSDEKHLAWVRQQHCCACMREPPNQAHHSTVGRGLSQKVSDRETMPLCGPSVGRAGCHADFHAARGLFEGMTKAQRTQWQNMMATHFSAGGATV